MSTNKYVWYLSYGSNLSKERFLCYLQGGTPTGSTKCEKGCRDTSLPIKDEPFVFSHPLYFAKNSVRWNGGIAFIKKEATKDTKTYGRMYLITEEQFMDIISQENNVVDIKIDFDEVKKLHHLKVSNGLYGQIIHIGDKGGFPIFTFTSIDDDSEIIFKKPSTAYLNTIVSGLKETFQMEQIEAIKYLSKSKELK